MWVRLMSTVMLLPGVTTGTRLRFATAAHSHTGHGHVSRRVHTHTSYRRGVATRASDEGDAGLLVSFDLAGVAQRIAEGKATRIVTMVRPLLSQKP